MKSWLSIGLLLVLFVAMYFFMIRPQKKKEKQIAEMRDSLNVGDEIITIGGIKGKVVTKKEDSLVIQVGADKQRIEMMKWAISEVTAKSQQPKKEESTQPKRLKKATPKDEEEKTDEKKTSTKTKKTTTKKTTTKTEAKDNDK